MKTKQFKFTTWLSNVALVATLQNKNLDACLKLHLHALFVIIHFFTEIFFETISSDEVGIVETQMFSNIAWSSLMFCFSKWWPHFNPFE
jgi:hypothetical protein